MSAGKLLFECGAEIPVTDFEACEHGPGDRLLVYSTIHKIGRPKMADGAGVNCLFACPCTVRASGRQAKVGYNERGERGRIVTCEVKDMVKVKGAACGEAPKGLVALPGEAFKGLVAVSGEASGEVGA